jgi:hypothetical protein
MSPIHIEVLSFLSLGLSPVCLYVVSQSYTLEPDSILCDTSVSCSSLSHNRFHITSEASHRFPNPIFIKRILNSSPNVSTP